MSIHRMRGAALAILMSTAALSACAIPKGTTGATSGIGPISPYEIPMMLSADRGVPTEADAAFHKAAVARCVSVVNDTRGNSIVAGVERGAVIAVTAYGASKTNPVMAPMADFQATYAGVYGGAQWAMVYRDGKVNYVFTCARDIEVEGIVWYSLAEIEDPARRAQLERYAEQARANVDASNEGAKKDQGPKPRSYWLPPPTKN